MSSPDALAVAVVIPRGDSVLLVQRAPGRPAAGYWTPVTGRVNPGESPAEAAVREASEEVGLQIEVPPEPYFECATELVDWWLLWFSARTVTDRPEMTLQSEEVSAFRWVTAQQLDQVAPMFERTRTGLHRFFAQRHQNLSAE